MWISTPSGRSKVVSSVTLFFQNGTPLDLEKDSIHSTPSGACDERACEERLATDGGSVGCGAGAVWVLTDAEHPRSRSPPVNAGRRPDGVEHYSRRVDLRDDQPGKHAAQTFRVIKDGNTNDKI